MLKIVTWNMACGQHKENYRNGWNFLTDNIQPDIALVQQSIPVPELANNYFLLWKSAGGTRNWGSSILVKKNLWMHEVNFINSYPGSIIAADVSLPDSSVVTFISLYGPLDKFGYSITALHRMLSDLTSLLDGKLKKRRFIIGGDFNASTQWDQCHGGKSHYIFFQRLEDFGLTDCLAKFHSGHVQTNRHLNNEVEWQTDYIYASNDIAKKITSCDVIYEPELELLGDHSPVVAIFNYE